MSHHEFPSTFFKDDFIFENGGDFNLEEFVRPEFLNQGNNELDTNLDMTLPSSSLDEFWGAGAEGQNDVPMVPYYLIGPVGEARQGLNNFVEGQNPHINNGHNHASYPQSAFVPLPGQDNDAYTGTHLPSTMRWSGSPIPSTSLPTTEMRAPASAGPSVIDVESPGPSDPLILAGDSPAFCKCLGCLARLGSFLCHDRYCQLPCETTINATSYGRELSFMNHSCLLGCGKEIKFYGCDELRGRSNRSWLCKDEQQHIPTHFLNEQKKYQCKEEGCKRIVKRWAELPRHYKTAHCLEPDNFPCDVFGCKYGGENGFKRRDKLTSHKKTHKGPGVPAQQLQKRLLKPKV